MRLGKEIPVKAFNKWITALYEGKYPQGIGFLQNLVGYCCLGVAQREVCKTPRLREDGLLAGRYPSHEVGSPNWLVDIDSEFLTLTGNTLSNLNDNQGFTHQDIAILLELVYVYKILG